MDVNARCPLTLRLAAIALCLAGCASQPLPDDPRSPPVVTRTSNSTVWSTPEAIAAAAAAAEAAERARVAGRGQGAGGSNTVAPAAAAAGAGKTTTAVATVTAAANASATPAPGTGTGPATRTLSAASTAPDLRRLAFDFDSFDIKAEFSPALEAHARWLAANPGARWVVEGHADDRGGSEYNLALGQKRAQAVLKALLLLGASEAQLEAVSLGDTRPLAEGRDEAAWAQNRRAELKPR